MSDFTWLRIDLGAGGAVKGGEAAAWLVANALELEVWYESYVGADHLKIHGLFRGISDDGKINLHGGREVVDEDCVYINVPNSTKSINSNLDCVTQEFNLGKILAGLVDGITVADIVFHLRLNIKNEFDVEWAKNNLVGVACIPYYNEGHHRLLGVGVDPEVGLDSFIIEHALTHEIAYRTSIFVDPAKLPVTAIIPAEITAVARVR